MKTLLTFLLSAFPLLASVSVAPTTGSSTSVFYGNWQKSWDFSTRPSTARWQYTNDGFGIVTNSVSYNPANLKIIDGAVYYAASPGANGYQYYILYTNTISVMRAEAILRYSTNWGTMPIGVYDGSVSILLQTLPLDTGNGTLHLQGDTLHMTFNFGGSSDVDLWTNGYGLVYSEPNSKRVLAVGNDYNYVDGEIVKVGFERTRTNAIVVYAGRHVIELQMDRLATNFFKNQLSARYIALEMGSGTFSTNIWQQAGIRSWSFAGQMNNYVPDINAIRPEVMNWSGITIWAFTSSVVGYLKFTNAGVVYSIPISTNLP